MSENQNNETLTGPAGATAMVETFAAAVGKVAAGRRVTVEEAMRLVMTEVAEQDPERFARLLRSLERVRLAS